MTAKRPATLWLSALLLTAATACGGGGGDDPDAVASIDDSDSQGDDSDSDSDDGGGRRPVDDSEFQDAMLDYAQCMRDHGIDMPDPEFDGGGGVAIEARPGGGSEDPTAQRETFEAAEEACSPIMEEVAPEMDMSPEEQAELQDKLVVMAQCMRDRGHDMPDPQIVDGGGIKIGMDDSGSSGERKGPDPEFEEDMEECNEEAGLDGGPGGGPRTNSSGGDD